MFGGVPINHDPCFFPYHTERIFASPWMAVRQQKRRVLSDDRKPLTQAFGVPPSATLIASSRIGPTISFSFPTPENPARVAVMIADVSSN